MPAEISSGGVLVRRMQGRWWFAAIRPQGKPEGVWALPKGLVDRGESAAATARRETFEETGVVGRLDEKLGDVRYVYTRGGRRIFKVVSFYLVRAVRGRIGELPPGMEREVAEVRSRINGLFFLVLGATVLTLLKAAGLGVLLLERRALVRREHDIYAFGAARGVSYATNHVSDGMHPGSGIAKQEDASCACPVDNRLL